MALRHRRGVFEVDEAELDYHPDLGSGLLQKLALQRLHMGFAILHPAAGKDVDAVQVAYDKHAVIFEHDRSHG